MRITTGVAVLLAGAAFAGCGGDDDEGGSSDGPEPQTKMAEFFDGENWAGGELRTCLETDGKLALVVGQEAEPIEKYDANNYFDIENKTAEILTFTSPDGAKKVEETYRSSFPEADEVGQKGNALYHLSASMDAQKAANMKGCLGV